MDDVVRQKIFECPCHRLIDRRGAGVDGDLIIPSTSNKKQQGGANYYTLSPSRPRPRHRPSRIFIAKY